MKNITCLAIPTGHNSSFHDGPKAGPAKTWDVLFNGAANFTTETGIDLGQRDDWQSLRSLSPNPGKEGYDLIYKAISAELAENRSVLSLGGDHALAYPVIAAHAERYPGLTVVQFDAHPDLYDNFENNPYSHASPFARLMETGLVSRLVQVGIRTANAHQLEQAQRFGVEIIEAWRWQEVLSKTFDAPVYVSLDLDVFDPAHAPGVSHHEPGGLTPRDVFTTLRHLPGLVGADLVELNPSRDHADMTAALAAKCVKELLGKLIEDT